MVRWLLDLGAPSTIAPLWPRVSWETTAIVLALKSTAPTFRPAHSPQRRPRTPARYTIAAEFSPTAPASAVELVGSHDAVSDRLDLRESDSAARRTGDPISVDGEGQHCSEDRVLTSNRAGASFDDHARTRR